MVPFCFCCNYAIVSHISMQFFNFVVLSVIIAPHNVHTPHISKTHLPIVLVNVPELELNCCSKVQPGKRQTLLCRGWKPNSTLKALRFIKWSSLSSQRYASSECGSV